MQNDPEPADRVRLVVAGDPEKRKQRLLEVVGRSGLLDKKQAKNFDEFLVNHHEAFSVEPGEQGETSLVQMEVDTGDAHPTRQPV